MKLVLQFNDMVDNPMIVLKKGEYLIGRSPECDIVINKNTISRKHCKVYFERDSWYVQDLKSTNGTYYQGEKLDEEPVKIKDGTVVLVHDIPILFSFTKKEKPQKSFPVEVRIVNDETDDMRIFDEVETVVDKFFLNKDVRKVIEYLDVVVNRTNIVSIGMVMLRGKRSELLLSSGNVDEDLLNTVTPLISRDSYNYRYGNRFLVIRRLFYGNYPVYSFFLLNSNHFAYTYLVNKINLILKLVYIFRYIYKWRNPIF